jgi:uncharacterized protein
MIQRSYAAVDLEVRGDGRTVQGLAVPFDQETRIADAGGSFVEVFRRGAFARTIRERGPQRVKLLAMHDARRLPLGRATVLREDPGGLYLEARVSQTQAGNEALELLRDGALDAFSVGFSIPTGGERWSQRRTHREIVEARLHEVSLVHEGAYEGAKVLAVRQAYDPRFDPALLRRRWQLATAPNRKLTP